MLHWLLTTWKIYSRLHRHAVAARFFHESELQPGRWTSEPDRSKYGWRWQSLGRIESALTRTPGLVHAGKRSKVKLLLVRLWRGQMLQPKSLAAILYKVKNPSTILRNECSQCEGSNKTTETDSKILDFLVGLELSFATVRLKEHREMVELQGRLSNSPTYPGVPQAVDMTSPLPSILERPKSLIMIFDSSCGLKYSKFSG